MRKLLILVLVAFLIGSWAIACDSCPGGKKTKVFWSIGPCWIILQVHPPVDLGEANSPSTLESDNHIVRVLTNCTGYQLQVRATRSHTPKGFCGDILEDFYWRVGNFTARPETTAQLIWIRFPSFGENLTVASTDSPSWDAGDTYLIDYKYIVDVCDVTGKYWLELCYTVTTP